MTDSGGLPRLPRRAVLAAVGLVVILTIAVAVVAEVSDLSKTEVHLRPGWLIPAVLGMLGVQLWHAENWRIIVDAMGYRIPGPAARSIWNVSMLGRYVPSGALMAVGRVVLAEREGVPRRTVAASVIYELLLAIAAATVVGAWFVVSLPAVRDIGPERWLAPIAAACALLVVCQPGVMGPLSAWALRRIGRDPLEQLLPGRAAAKIMLSYLGSFVLGGLATVALVLAFHPLDVSDVPTVVAAYSVGFVSGFVGFLLPGGLGVREAGLTGALIAAVPAGPAAVTAIGSRLAQIVIEVALAAITPVLARRAERAKPGSMHAEPVATPAD